MTESQGWILIGIALWVLATFDKPIDHGTLIYVGAAIFSFGAALGARR